MPHEPVSAKIPDARNAQKPIYNIPNEGTARSVIPSYLNVAEGNQNQKDPTQITPKEGRIPVPFNDVQKLYGPSSERQLKSTEAARERPIHASVDDTPVIPVPDPIHPLIS